MEAVFPWEGLPERRKGQHWSEAVARQVLRRVAEGESLRAVCRDPEMPAYELVKDWMRKRPAFRAQVVAARTWCGRNLVMGSSGYCHATAGEILQRLGEGESLTAICRDPEMPGRTSVYRWAEQVAEFGAALRAARASQADVYADLGWDWVVGAAREEAYLTHVKLQHLRWYVGKLGPGLFGPVRAAESAAARGARLAEAQAVAEAEAAANAPQEFTWQVRDFRMEVDRAGRRWRSVEVFHTPGSNVLRRAATAPWMDWDPERDGERGGLEWDGVE